MRRNKYSLFRKPVSLVQETEQNESDLFNKTTDSHKHYLHYRTLIDTGRALIWTSGIDKKCDYFNQTWLDFTGRTLEQELNDGWTISVHPDDFEPSFRFYSAAFDRREKFSMVYRLKRYDNVYRWIQDDGTPLFSDNGVFIGYIGYCRDITETKLKEESFRKTEAQYRVFINSSTDMVFLKDQDFRYLIINKANAVFFNKEEIEIIGKTDFDLLPEDIAAKCHLTDNLALSSDIVITNEEVVGDTVYESRKFKIQLENGQYGVGGYIRDITGSKQLQKELITSEKKFKSLFENANDGIYIIDLEGNFIEANSIFCDRIGVTKDELLKIKIKDLDTPEFVPFVKKRIEEVRKSGWAVFETAHISRSGKIIPTEINSRVVEYGGKQVLQSIARDITDRKHTEQIQKILFNISNAAITTNDLEELITFIRTQLGILIDTTNFFIAFYDEATEMLTSPHFSDQKIFLPSVSAGRSLTGYTIRQNKACLFHFEEIMKMINDGVIDQFGVTAECWLGSPLRIDGKIIGAFVVQSYDDPHAFNESDLKLFEFSSSQISISIQGKRSQVIVKESLLKAEESDRLKTAFLHNISHEIRTPMNAIVGFSSLLGDKSSTNAEQASFIDTIQKSANNLLSIVTDIITISNLEADTLKTNVTRTNLNELIKSLYNQFHPVATDKNLQLYFDLTITDAVAEILTDSTKLSEILSNLISNAIKFTPKGFIKFGYIQEHSLLKFYVSDTGIGIPPEYQMKIFNRFYQVDTNISRTYEGTGLGLSICKSYVELLGGKIWVTSEPENGSIFYFTLPFHKVNQTKMEVSPSPFTDVKYHDKTILVAEDDENSLQLIKMMLSRLGMSVLHAHNGSEAIEICKNNLKVDLIFMDMKMPLIDGYEATRQIKKIRSDLPVIAQTAYTLSGDLEKAINAGCDDYIGIFRSRDKF